MGLNWNEIKSRALLFSKTWADACNEDSQAKPFWIDFFEIFGITNKRVATFELNVKKLGGAQGFVDLFWPGVLLVEHKSRGKSLDDAVELQILKPFKQLEVKQSIADKAKRTLEHMGFYTNADSQEAAHGLNLNDLLLSQQQMH
jgi:hypothetical protein